MILSLSVCRRDLGQMTAPDEPRSIGEDSSGVFVDPVDGVASQDYSDPSQSWEYTGGTYVTGRPSLSLPKT